MVFMLDTKVSKPLWYPVYTFCHCWSILVWLGLFPVPDMYIHTQKEKVKFHQDEVSTLTKKRHIHINLEFNIRINSVLTRSLHLTFWVCVDPNRLRLIRQFSDKHISGPVKTPSWVTCVFPGSLFSGFFLIRCSCHSSSSFLLSYR